MENPVEEAVVSFEDNTALHAEEVAVKECPVVEASVEETGFVEKNEDSVCCLTIEDGCELVNLLRWTRE